MIICGPTFYMLLAGKKKNPTPATHGSSTLELRRETKPQRFLDTPPPGLAFQALIRILPLLHTLFHGRLVDRVQHFLVHPDIVSHEGPDAVPHPRNLLARRRSNELVHRRIDRLGRFFLQPCDADFLSVPFAVRETGLLRDPHVAVHAEDHVDLAAAVCGCQREHVRLGPLDALRVDLDEVTVPELPVLQRAGVQ